MVPKSLPEVQLPPRHHHSATLSTRFVANPSGAGFNWGGGFSPNGAELAVFVSLTEKQYQQTPRYIQSTPVTQLALVDTKTDAIHVVPGAYVNNGEAVAWAQWLPDNQHLITGSSFSPAGELIEYLVDANTDQVLPISFVQGGAQLRDTTVNLSGVIQPGR